MGHQDQDTAAYNTTCNLRNKVVSSKTSCNNKPPRDTFCASLVVVCPLLVCVCV